MCILCITKFLQAHYIKTRKTMHHGEVIYRRVTQRNINQVWSKIVESGKSKSDEGSEKKYDERMGKNNMHTSK